MQKRAIWELPQWFSAFYGKRFGVFTSSGTLALESAILLLTRKTNANVFVPSICTWKVSFACVRATDNIIQVDQEKYALTKDDLLGVSLTDDSIVVAVHPWGLYCDVKELRIAVGQNSRIVEDVSQAWYGAENVREVGQNSDIVITSFGSTKPVTLAYGGALFFDNAEWMLYFDMITRPKTEIASQRIPYGLQCPGEMLLSQAITRADNEFTRRTAVAEEINRTLPQYAVNYSCRQPRASWTRVPLLFADSSASLNFKERLVKAGIAFQEPSRPFHEHSLQRSKNLLDRTILLWPTGDTQAKWAQVL